MDKEMLEKIRVERPEQKINEVIFFKVNKYGFFNVKINVDVDEKIKNLITTIPYPFSEYEKLSKGEQAEWIFHCTY